MQDVLETQRKKNIGDTEVCQNYGHTAGSAQSANSAGGPTQDPESATLAIGGSQSPLRPANTAPEHSLGAAEVHETIRLSVQETSRGAEEEDADVERAIQENVSQL